MIIGRELLEFAPARQSVRAVPAREHEGPPEADPALLREFAEALVDRARADGVQLTGENGLLTDLVRQVLQTGLEVEMTEHLGYDRHEVAGRGSGNSRNGSYPKTVSTEIGDVTVQVPRDRNGSFEPATIRSMRAVSTVCRAT